MAHKTRKQIRRLVCLSDIHVGSTKGLLQPGFTTLEGNKVSLNAMQEWLWLCWEKANNFIDKQVGDEPFALVVNGDIIEGIHHGTKEIWSPEIADQRRAAVEILKPLVAKAAASFIVRGTECHVQNTESGIGEQLECVKDEQTGLHAFDRLVLELNGIRHVFRHHIGTSVRRGLAGTQLSANLAEEQVEAANNGEKIPRVVVCSHRHKFGVYQDTNGLLVVTPPFQGLTRFGHKVVSQARTNPGIVILDYSEKEYGELPAVVEKTFKTPEAQAIELR
jgi:hypothetical protein